MTLRATAWLVLDMDDGVCRVEPTRRDAVSWLCGLNGGVVKNRYQIRPGAYSYVVGYPGDPYSCTSRFVERADAAVQGGWDIHQKPLYPHPDEPYAREDRDPEPGHGADVT